MRGTDNDKKKAGRETGLMALVLQSRFSSRLTLASPTALTVCENEQADVRREIQ